jgi:type II secretory ATPase GspE/PulE/Tfp pilus assembly ATPase PilB-like protein
LYKGVGCDECKEGYSGRIGIFEVFEMNPAMEKLLLNRATTNDIQNQAIKDGMLTMQQDGFKGAHGCYHCRRSGSRSHRSLANKQRTY